MDRNVFLVTPPLESTPSKYLMLVTRAGGGFMGGSSSAFAVDTVGRIDDERGNAACWRGFRGEKLIVEIPVGTPYILVDRDQTELLTAVDAAKRGKAEQDELDKLVDVTNGPGEFNHVGTAPGQYL